MDTTETYVTPAVGQPLASRYPAADAAEASTSSVAWAAVVGGALAAVAATLILMALGSGLGLASVAPWPYAGASLKTFTAMAAIWLIVVQWVSSALGGYLTGRMRTRWVGVHDQEVFFRDTANGVLSWGLATVIGAVVLASVAGSLIGGAARGAVNLAAGTATVATAAAQSATAQPGNNASAPFAYFADDLFRPVSGTSGTTDANAPAANAAAPAANAMGADAATRGEAARIFANGLTTGEIPASDKTYLAQTVAAHTGMSQADAEKRVNDVVAQVNDAEAKARQAADAARKAGAALAVFTALSMLIGAFIAAAAGGLGGHHRDRWSAELARL
jgi:hypothetical protein